MHHKPEKPDRFATSHLQSCQSAPPLTTRLKCNVVDPTETAAATSQEARSIANWERWLQSLKATEIVGEMRHEALAPSLAHKLATSTPSRVLQLDKAVRKVPPTTAIHHSTALPADGWVRIVSELNIAASSVEMWLRIDRCSGYILDFRIGRKPRKS